MNTFLLFCKYLSIYEKTGSEPSPLALSAVYDVIYSSDEQMHRLANDAANKIQDSPFKKNKDPSQVGANQELKAPQQGKYSNEQTNQKPASVQLPDGPWMENKDYQDVLDLIKAVTSDSTGCYPKSCMKGFVQMFKNSNLKKATEYYKIVEAGSSPLTSKQMIVFGWYLLKDSDLISIPKALPPTFQAFINGKINLPIQPPQMARQEYAYQPSGQNQFKPQPVPQDFNPLTDERTNPQFQKPSPPTSIRPQIQPNNNDHAFEELVKSLVISYETKKAQQVDLIRNLEISQAENMKLLNFIKQTTASIQKSIASVDQFNASLQRLKSTSETNQSSFINLKSQLHESVQDSNTLIQQVTDCSDLISDQAAKLTTLEQSIQDLKKTRATNENDQFQVEKVQVHFTREVQKQQPKENNDDNPLTGNSSALEGYFDKGRNQSENKSRFF